MPDAGGMLLLVAPMVGVPACAILAGLFTARLRWSAPFAMLAAVLCLPPLLLFHLFNTWVLGLVVPLQWMDDHETPVMAVLYAVAMAEVYLAVASGRRFLRWWDRNVLKT